MSGLYRGFGARPPVMPLKRGTVDFSDEAGMQAVAALLDGAALPPVVETADAPFVGVTTDGRPRTELFTLADEGACGRGAAAAARRYLDLLDPARRGMAQYDLHAKEWQRWSNAFLTYPEHGLQLQELDPQTRDAALAVVEASISPEGYRQVRKAMQLNGALGELLNTYLDTLTEFCYWFTLFGDPSPDAPWGWQLQGHHVDLNCVFIGEQMVLTPTFLGTEFHGEDLFTEHQQRGRELMDSLDAAQRDKALLYGSMLAADLPPELAGKVDGRHRAGAGQDNLVLPYIGLSGLGMRPGQRELLLALTDPYLAGLPQPARQARRAQVERHLDETHLGWIGTWEEEAPFYYRVHSPVLLVEYDNHPGIFLDNDEPEPFHVHTIVRTPNGGDYGKELLRQHYAEHHRGTSS